MDGTTRNTLELCLKEWVENSILFKDSERWKRELEQELNEIPRLEEEIRSLKLEINIRLQSLLFNRGFTNEEVAELSEMPATAIDIIDSEGGLEKWRMMRKQNYQHSAPTTL